MLCLHCNKKINRKIKNDFKNRTMHKKCYIEYEQHRLLKDWLILTGRLPNPKKNERKVIDWYEPYSAFKARQNK